MFIPPVERARVKRQQRNPNPVESFLSRVFNPGAPTTSTSVGTSTTTRLSETATTAPTTTRTLSSSSSSSTSGLTTTSTSTSTSTLTSTSSQRAAPTSALPLTTPEDSIKSTNQATTTVTHTSSSASPSGSGTSDASINANQTANGSMTPLVKGIVISASVIFGLIFLALVIRRLFQFRRRQKRVSWADNISPFAPTAHETGYEKPLSQEAAPTPVPAAAAAPPPSTRYGSQDVGYGPMIGAAGFGANLDQRNSHYSSTGTGYTTYQNYPAQPAVPYGYNPASMGAGAAAAAVDGPSGLAYNNVSASPPMPNPFGVSPVDTTGPVPIGVPVAPPVAGQRVLIVKRTFTPNLEDELSIITGESVIVVAVYDDGWCKVRKMGAGAEEGVVPYECLDNPAADAQPGLGPAENDQSRRASSLYDAPRA